MMPEPDTKDRRAKRVMFTARGLAYIKAGQDFKHAMQSSLEKQFGKKKLQQLAADLDNIRRVIDGL